MVFRITEAEKRGMMDGRPTSTTRKREKNIFPSLRLVDGTCKQGFQLHDAWKHGPTCSTSTTSSIVYANVFILISAPQPFLKKILGLLRQMTHIKI